MKNKKNSSSMLMRWLPSILGGIFFISSIVVFIRAFSLHQQNATDTDSIANIKKQLEACLNEDPINFNTTQAKYSFDKIGIFSPLLVDKDVSVTTYEIQGNMYSTKSIVIENPETKKKIYLTLYQLIKMNYPNLKSLDYATGKYNPGLVGHDFLIPNGYEGGTTQLSFYLNNWQSGKAEVFKNSHQMTFYIGYFYAPKSIGGVTYSFYDVNLQGSSSYVEVSTDIDNYPFVDDINDRSVVQAKQELREFVDTLSWSPYR